MKFCKKHIQRFATVIGLIMVVALIGTARTTAGLQSVEPYTAALLLNSSVTANNDLITMYENHPTVADVLNNDFGLSEGVKSLKIVIPPNHGKAIVNNDNTITYTPNIYYIGNDAFTYEVCNIHGDCDQARVDIRILDYDFKPKAIDDIIYIEFGKVQFLDVLANDLNLYDIPLTLTILRDFTHGITSVTEDLLIETTFTSLFTDKDSLVYQICDKEGDCSIANVYVLHYTDMEREAYIPEGFSPNGDGINDTFFVPDYIYIEKIKIRIVNKQGILIFEDNNFVQWDGISNTGPINGQLVPAGTYYYFLDVPGIKKNRTGFVYLAR